MMVGSAIVIGLDAINRNAAAEGGIEVAPSFCPQPPPPLPQGTSGGDCVRPPDSCLPTFTNVSWFPYCCKDAPNGGCIQIWVRRQCCKRAGQEYGWGFAYKTDQAAYISACDFQTGTCF